MITDEILFELSNNRFNYNEEAQTKDVSLICNFLKAKYNSEELNDVSLLLIKNINLRQLGKKSWFAND